MEFQSNYSIINCARVQHCIQFISCRLSKTLTHLESPRPQTPLCTSGIKAKRELPNNFFFSQRIKHSGLICQHQFTAISKLSRKSVGIKIVRIFFRVNKHVKHHYLALLSENIKCLTFFIFWATSISERLLCIIEV